jgi:hypothetical protein
MHLSPSLASSLAHTQKKRLTFKIYYPYDTLIRLQVHDLCLVQHGCRTIRTAKYTGLDYFGF